MAQALTVITATGLLYTGRGALAQWVMVPSAAEDERVIFHDGVDATGPVLFVHAPNGPISEAHSFPDPLKFKTGLFAELIGTAPELSVGIA